MIYLVNMSEKDYIRKKNKWLVMVEYFCLCLFEKVYSACLKATDVNQLNWPYMVTVKIRI